MSKENAEKAIHGATHATHDALTRRALPGISSGAGNFARGSRGFKYFKLPPELRLMILRYVCFEPRSLVLWLQPLNGDWAVHEITKAMENVTSGYYGHCECKLAYQFAVPAAQKHPSVLTCARTLVENTGKEGLGEEGEKIESECLKYYGKEFAYTFEGSFESVKVACRADHEFLVNMKSDTLCFLHPNILKDLGSLEDPGDPMQRLASFFLHYEQPKKVKSIALGENYLTELLDLLDTVSPKSCVLPDYEIDEITLFWTKFQSTSDALLPCYKFTLTPASLHSGPDAMMKLKLAEKSLKRFCSDYFPAEGNTKWAFSGPKPPTIRLAILQGSRGRNN